MKSRVLATSIRAAAGRCDTAALRIWGLSGAVAGCAANEPKAKLETPAPVELDENVACDVCGRFGSVEIGERHLCVDCYGSCGSGCAEATMEARADASKF